MFAELALVAALASTPKVDREPPKGCILAESFENDLRSAGGFFVIEAEREVAIRYIVALVTIGYTAPAIDIDKLDKMLVITSPEAPDTVLIALVDSDGVICVAAVIPKAIHDAVLRGA